MMTPKPQLIQWIDRDLRFINSAGLHVEHDGSIDVELHTMASVYCITAQGNYLGCVSRNKKTGRLTDLSDGAYTETTWRTIIGEIVGAELAATKQPVQRRAKAA